MRFKSSSRKPVQPELVASRDLSRPVLTTVHLNAEASEVWVTDSYMAARFPVELDESDTSGPIPIEALKAMRKPPLGKYVSAGIKLNGNAEVQQYDSDGKPTGDPYLTMPRESSEYTFPSLNQHFPDNLSDFEIGFSAEKLARLAKAMGTDDVRLRFSVAPPVVGVDNPSVDEKKPSNLRQILVRPMGKTGADDPVGLLMPARFDRD